MTWTHQRRCLATMAWICAVLSTVATNAFVHTLSRRCQVVTNTRLYTSLSTPTGRNFTAFDDNDKSIGSRRVGNPIKIIPMQDIDQTKPDDDDENDDDDESVQFNDFHKYLKKVAFRIRNSKKRACIMDDELKRLETNFYNLTGKDSPKCLLPPPQNSYNGPVLRPDAKCYTMVINAYAKPGLGRTEAHLAEEVCRRFEVYNPGVPSNAFMMKGLLKAWIGVENLKKAEECLSKMEECYASTRHVHNAPDMMVYTLFLEALASSVGEYEAQAGPLSLKILHRMRTSYLSGNNPQAMPTLRTYLAVMRCQECSSRGIIAVNKIRKILEQLENDYNSFGRPETCKPNAQATKAVISAASKCRGNMQAIGIMEEVIQKLQKRFEETGEHEYRPLDPMYTLLFSAYSKVNTENAQRCSQKVDEFLAVIAKNEMTPSIFATTSAIRALVNDKSDTSLKKAENLMRNLESPDAIVYQSLIKGYCRNGNPEKADQILQELETASGSDVMTMAACLDAWSKVVDGYDAAIERAECLLERIIHKYRMGLVGHDEKHVDSWIFECVARLWLRSRKSRAGDEILALIGKMRDINRDVPAFFRPTENLYILALDSLSTSDRHAGHKALNIFNEIQSLSIQGILPSPSLRVLSTVVASLAKSSARGSVRRAHEIYQLILKKYESGEVSEPLNPRMLSSLFRSILRSTDKESGKFALEVLQETCEFASKHPSLVAPNTIVFNTILDGLARKESPDEAWETLELMIALAKEGFSTTPDVASFCCTARALASIATPTTLSRTNSLVRSIMRLYETGELVPDVQLFNTLLMSYKIASISDDEAARNALRLLDRLEDLSKKDSNLAPEAITYRTVSEALLKSKMPGSLTMVENVYLRAKSRATSGQISPPDRELCYAAISAYARSSEEGSLEKAEAIINEMELRRNYSQNELEIPNTRVYNRVLFAYASSGRSDQIRHVKNLFDNMMNAYKNGDKNSQPNIHSYNSLILAAAKSKSLATREDFELALESFKTLHSEQGTLSPNSATYEYFIQACTTLLPVGSVQTKLVLQAFKLCQQRGLVSPLVVRQIYNIIPEVKDELEKLPASSFSTMGDKMSNFKQHSIDLIPLSWCSGVPEKYRKRKVEFLGGSIYHQDRDEGFDII